MFILLTSEVRSGAFGYKVCPSFLPKNESILNGNRRFVTAIHAVVQAQEAVSPRN